MVPNRLGACFPIGNGGRFNEYADVFFPCQFFVISGARENLLKKMTNSVWKTARIFLKFGFQN